MIRPSLAWIRSVQHCRLGARRLASVCGLLFVATASGCQGAASLWSALSGPDVIPPLYVLEDVPTAVMVDDPNNRFENPSMVRQVATTAVFHLQRNEVLLEAAWIEPGEVARLERRLGRAWATTPIDEIGRELGAEVVIHAKIIEVNERAESGLFRPTATVEVKVINAEDGQRLWPNVAALPDPDAPPPPGHRFTVEMNYQAREARGTPSDIGRALADRLGLQLGRVFFEWTLPEPGETL